ncbi:hypothetical protein LEP1GSC007_0550 [Leptospira interrogans serovar Bulgarica str. Mallika]|nr:hypothetical protein LEP1GSC007_0550 [Leptospira interrogans serovar Bulgarica str. Mallika]EJP15450.1 hypothetical protein LEP1GSC080_3489 [Leptospira interrogans str. FPW2026]
MFKIFSKISNYIRSNSIVIDLGRSQNLKKLILHDHSLEIFNKIQLVPTN